MLLLNFPQVLPQRVEVSVEFSDEFRACGARLLYDRVFPHETAILSRYAFIRLTPLRRRRSSLRPLYNRSNARG
jgi:hypothetical protein